MRIRAIFGCAGQKLEAAERDFFKAVRPWGFILFARNIRDRAQICALVDDLRGCIDDAGAPVLIDQEGGRVARLGPPSWRSRAPAARFGRLFADNSEAAREAAYLNSRLIAYDLAELGINVDCLPVLDVPADGANEVIGDRAYASDPSAVIALGRAAIDGLRDGGVLPVMKHMPGHGRALLDSHLDLPKVEATIEHLSAADFVTFRSLNQCPMGMTAHVVYTAIDKARPATLSARIVRDVIRGEIGFDGLLMTDDLSMGALKGTMAARTKAALLAGCDIVLHCNGKMDEMREIAEVCKPLEGVHLHRAEQAMAQLAAPAAFDPAKAEARLVELMGMIA